MILDYKITQRKKSRLQFRGWKWREDITSIKNASTTIGFMPYVHFKNTF